MEQKETATQQKKSSEAENKAEEVKNVKDKSPTTPTTPGSTWGSTWGGWLSQAKEKVSLGLFSTSSLAELLPFQSASVLEAVKNDLNEITTAVSDTFHVATPEDEMEDPKTPSEHSQASSSNFNLKQSLSSFFGSVTDALIPQIDEEDATEAVLITSDDTIVLTGFAKHLADLQSNDETYLEEPSKTEELAEKYRMWLEIVEQDQFTQQKVNKMLESSQILNEK